MPPFGTKRPVDTITRQVANPESAYGATEIAEDDPSTLSLRDADQIHDTIASGPTFVTGLDAELVHEEPERRYRPKALLGEGGMGEVRLSHDRHIGRDVAMKIMRSPKDKTAEFRTRFLREARVQGQLEHPAVPPVYDLGQDATGKAFFTMRRLRGETLEAILERLRNKDSQARAEYTRHRLLASFQRVCLAVDFAHKKGVVHRDMKPGNIMFGDFGEVYVLDWGLARLVEARSSDRDLPPSSERAPVADDSGAETDVGAILGTPGYMAPEQILGQIEEIDARTDVYSLGVVLFEILTHEPLFTASAANAIFRQTLQGVETRPSLRTPDRDIDPELDAIVVRATKTAPEDRFQTARELHDALERYLSGDRDVEQRRALARVHADRAADLAAKSTSSSDPSDRKAALRELGRALALDPENPEALRLLLGLVTDLPKTIPPEVEEMAIAGENAMRRAAHRVGARMLGLAVVLVFVPMFLLMGVQSWGHAAIVLGAWSTAGVVNLVMYKTRRMMPAPFVLLLTGIAVASASVFFGPLVFTPAIAVVTTTAYVTSGQRRWRFIAVLIGCLTVLLPSALELAGIVSPSYTFDGTAIHVVSRAVSFPPGITQGVLLVTQLLPVMAVAYYVGRYRDLLVSAELKNHLRVWQLRQLVPEEASGALTPASNESVGSLRILHAPTVRIHPPRT